jgi:tetratricopeptide (TPR) repeat protein
MQSESVASQATTRGRERRGRRAIVTRSSWFRRVAQACCATALALVCTGRPAGAADQPDARLKAEARAHLRRGAELIDAEDLQGALVQFEAAYRLVPNPSILHNFGIVYQGLGRKAAALEAFQRFLDEAARPPAQTREHAEKAVSTLRGEVAELRVQSDVDGATIFVDARKVGETPQRRPIYLDPGPHHLSVEKPGLGTVHAARLQASAGQQLTVPARLAARAPAAAPLPAPAGQVTETQPAPAESARPGSGPRPG